MVHSQVEGKMELLKIKENNVFIGMGILDINTVSESLYRNWEERISECRKKAVCYKKEIDKKRSVCSEILIKELGSFFLKVDKDNLKLQKEKSGKPYFSDINYSISISHSGAYVVGIISDAKVGIDIEKMSDLEWKTVNHIFSVEDLEYIQGQEHIGKELTETQNERFFEVWTTKEAYAKMCGTGLTKSIFLIPHSDIVSKIILFDGYVVSYVFVKGEKAYE